MPRNTHNAKSLGLRTFWRKWRRQGNKRPASRYMQKAQ